MLLGEAGLAGGVGTQDWEGPGRQRGGRGRGRWAVAMKGLGAEGIRRGEEGRGGGLDPGRETSHHPPEGPEVDPDVDCQAGGRRESQNLPRIEAGRAG